MDQLRPKSWSTGRTMSEFQVSARMVKQAEELKDSEGVLAMPGKRQGKKLAEDTKLAVEKIESVQFGNSW